MAQRVVNRAGGNAAGIALKETEGRSTGDVTWALAAAGRTSLPGRMDNATEWTTRRVVDVMHTCGIYREVQQVRTDATHTQRQRAAPAHHHVTVASDGEIVHVHKSSQMSTDTAGVHETTDSSGCMNEGDKGVEEITEAEYMRGVKRKRDPG